jgi:hypothetical protein
MRGTWPRSEWSSQGRRIALCALCVLGGGVLARPAAASIIIQDWNNLPSTTEGWMSMQTWVDLQNPGSGGVDGSGYLRIHLDATDTEASEPGAEWYALARTPGSTYFAGNYTDRQLAFDFFAANVEPTYVQIRWQSTTNTSVWRSTLYASSSGNMPVGSWTSMIAPQFASYTDWNYGGGNQEQFISDLSSVDWIGIYVWRNGAEEQDYGLDDVSLMVPEPGEYLMLASALIALAYAMRKRLNLQSCLALVTRGG